MSCSGVHTPLQTIIARGGLVTDFLGGPSLRASAPCLSGGDASLLASHAPSAAFPLRTTPANPSSLKMLCFARLLGMHALPPPYKGGGVEGV